MDHLSWLVVVGAIDEQHRLSHSIQNQKGRGWGMEADGGRWTVDSGRTGRAALLKTEKSGAKTIPCACLRSTYHVAGFRARSGPKNCSLIICSATRNAKTRRTARGSLVRLPRQGRHHGGA